MPLSFLSTSRIFREVGTIIILLGLAVGVLLACSFVLQIMGGIFLGVLMSSGETVLHSTPSPDNKITALVISDGCGITCGCTVRVDLKKNDQYIEDIWRGIDVCEATVIWLSPTEFNILDDNNQSTRIDVHTVGLSP
ncbi:MAG: hypothetical protein AB1801_10875 [Chloroflexota bacterium]